MCSINKLNKKMRGIENNVKNYRKIIKRLLGLLFAIFCIFLLFNETVSIATNNKLSSLTDNNIQVISVMKSNRYKKFVKNKKLKGYKHINKFSGVNYKNLGPKEKSYLDNNLSKKTQVNIMMGAIRHGFRCALGLCIILITCLIICDRLKTINNYKLNYFHKIGPMCSIQIISAISVYSIILNFVDNAPKEPNFITNTIIFMIAVMCTTFVVYTASSLMHNKE